MVSGVLASVLDAIIEHEKRKDHIAELLLSVLNGHCERDSGIAFGRSASCNR